MARTKLERVLDDRSTDNMRGKSELRDLSAAADDVLRERGQRVTEQNRAQVINEREERTGR